MMNETSNLTDALRGEKCFGRQVAPFQRPLDKPARCPYNAASSEGKSSGTDAKERVGTPGSNVLACGDGQFCPSGNKTKLLECLLSRL
jgi:hypothetical protein